MLPRARRSRSEQQLTLMRRDEGSRGGGRHGGKENGRKDGGGKGINFLWKRPLFPMSSHKPERSLIQYQTHRERCLKGPGAHRLNSQSLLSKMKRNPRRSVRADARDSSSAFARRPVLKAAISHRTPSYTNSACTLPPSSIHGRVPRLITQ